MFNSVTTQRQDVLQLWGPTTRYLTILRPDGKICNNFQSPNSRIEPQAIRNAGLNDKPKQIAKPDLMTNLSTPQSRIEWKTPAMRKAGLSDKPEPNKVWSECHTKPKPGLNMTNLSKTWIECQPNTKLNWIIIQSKARLNDNDASWGQTSQARWMLTCTNHQQPSLMECGRITQGIIQMAQATLIWSPDKMRCKAGCKVGDNVWWCPRSVYVLAHDIFKSNRCGLLTDIPCRRVAEIPLLPSLTKTLTPAYANLTPIMLTPLRTPLLTPAYADLTPIGHAAKPFRQRMFWVRIKGFI